MTNSITDNDLNEFRSYVNTFYNENNGIYPIASREEIDEAINEYINSIDDTDDVTWGFGDSLDRERVRHIIGRYVMKLTDIIIVDNGDIFHGTREQFMNCFFSNANDDEIESWCISYNWNLVINDKLVIK